MSEMNENSQVPGQMVLFREVMQCETRRLKSLAKERFCWEYVTSGGKAPDSYLATINPSVDRVQASKNASKLLNNGEIRRRIDEIAQIIRQKYMNEVIAFRAKTLNFDPGLFFKNGSLLRVHDLPEDLRKGIGLEAKIVDGCLHYLPVFPSPEKAADALQKIFEMNKEGLALTGPNGVPLGDGITDIERASRLAAILDTARTRRDGQDPAGGDAPVGASAGSAE
jgi:hypothetical protein